MSITRLQQARQMYAMGQRVGRIAFGGGGTQGDGDYQGGGRDDKGSVSGSAPGAGSAHNSNTSSGADDRSSDTQQYNHYEAISQNTGVDNNRLRPSGIEPGFIKPGDIDGLTLSPYEQRRVDFLNTPYKPMNIPLGVPGGTLLNTVGNFIGGIGANKNRQFFADNVAGKYDYNYDPTQTGSYEKAYQRYMKDRMAGKVGAYGNKEQGQNALSGQGGGQGEGIMNIPFETIGDNLSDDTEEVEFVSRYLQNQPEDIREEIESRMKNYYTA